MLIPPILWKDEDFKMLKQAERYVLLSIIAWLNGITGKYEARSSTITADLKISTRRLNPILAKLHETRWIIREPGKGRGNFTVIKKGDKLSTFYEIKGGRFYVKKGDKNDRNVSIINTEEKTHNNNSPSQKPDDDKVITTISNKPLRLSFWNWLKGKCNGKTTEAIRILYRAKEAKYLERFIKVGFNKGYIHERCKDEENSPKKVNEWVEKVLDFVNKNGY
jgi:hypothetical protein